MAGQVAQETDELLASMAAEMGIETVAEADVPAPPKVKDRDTARWNFLEEYLPKIPGTWKNVKTFDNLNSAGLRAAKINSNKDGQFPSDKFEARHKRNKEEGTSTLIMRAVAS
jgi:hypothetical protein